MENKKMEKLIRRAKRGSESAFVEIIRLKTRVILYHSMNILGQDYDLEKVAQNIVLAMHEDIKNLSDPEMFNVWLHKIIRDQCDKLENEHLPQITNEVFSDVHYRALLA